MGAGIKKITRAQALLELALFAGLMLLILLAALNYKRNLSEQRGLDVDVFAKTKDAAYAYQFTYTDTEGETHNAMGSTISWNENWDRQSRRIFQPQRRSSAAGYTVFWSNAEDPPDQNYMYYNNNFYQPPKKKLEYYRAGNEAFGNATEELKVSTWDWIALAAAPLADLVGHFMVKIGAISAEWWGKWGSIFTLALRIASFTYFLIKFLDVMDELDDVERRRKELEEQDKQMGEWGWRVASVELDGEVKAGEWYIKEVTAQTWDSQSRENKSYNYRERQRETRSSTRSSRTMGLSDNLSYNLQQRFDVTAPDPTIPLASHSFEPCGGPSFSIDLGGAQSETWTTAK